MKLTKESSIFVDLIRGVSSQLVLIGHLISFYGINIGLFKIQDFGVVLFFLISGFLITMSIDNKGSDYNFKEFLIDRFSRIFIAYIPALIIISILDLILLYIFHFSEYNKAISFSSFISNILMLQDFPLIEFIFKKLEKFNFLTSFGSARQLWTVAIEWWIYIFIGYLMLQKFTIKSIGILLLSFFVILTNVAGRGNGLTIMWFLGSLTYFITNKNVFNPIRNKIFLFIILILPLIIFRLKVNQFNVYDAGFYTLLASIFLLIIIFLQNNINFKIKYFESFFKFLADYSFSLYLLHYTIIVFFMNLNLKLNINLQIIILFVLINIISFLFSKIFETHYLTLRDKIKKYLH